MAQYLGTRSRERTLDAPPPYSEEDPSTTQTTSGGAGGQTTTPYLLRESTKVTSTTIPSDSITLVPDSPTSMVKRSADTKHSQRKLGGFVWLNFFEGFSR